MSDIETNEALAVLGIATAVAIGSIWLYRRSQKPTTSSLMDPAQLAQLPAPEEEEIRLAQLTEEEIIRLGQLEEEEEIILAQLPSERDKRRQGGGITIL